MKKKSDYKKLTNINRTLARTGKELLEIIDRSFKNERRDFKFVDNLINDANELEDMEKFEEYREPRKEVFHRIIESKQRDLTMLRVILDGYIKKEKKTLKEEILENVRL